MKKNQIFSLNAFEYRCAYVVSRQDYCKDLESALNAIAKAEGKNN